MTTPNNAKSSDAPGASAGVYRDGDDLLVQCGADLSRSCISCGKPAAGKPIVWRFGSGQTWAEDTHGSGSGGSVFDVLLLLFLLASYTMAVIHERKTRRRQFITLGLCPSHRRRRKRITRLALLTILAGLWAMLSMNRRFGHQTNVFPAMAMIGGPIVGIIGSLIIASRISNLKLAATKDGWLRIKGVGAEFLRSQPTMPKAS